MDSQKKYWESDYQIEVGNTTWREHGVKVYQRQPITHVYGERLSMPASPQLLANTIASVAHETCC